MVFFNDLFLFSSLKEPIRRKEEWDLPVSPGYGRSCRSLAGQSSEDPGPHSSRGAWFAFSPSSPCFITSHPPHPTPVRSNQPTTLLQDDRTRSGTLCGNNLPGWKGVPRKRSDTEGLFQASASDTIHEAAPFWNTHSAFLYTLTAVPLQPKSVTQSCIWTLWHHLVGTIWTWFCRDTLEFPGQILQSAVQHSKSSNQRSSRKGGIMPETFCSRGQCEKKENDATLRS